MIFKQGMSLIVTIVQSGFSAKVLDVSRAAGAEGATVLQGRGVGIHESDTIMGIDIQPGKEIVFILARKSQRKMIMKEIVRACNLATEGKGMTFCLPVDEVAGANHLFGKKMEPKEKVEQLPKERVQETFECKAKNIDNKDGQKPTEK
ncbi:MAG: P-II family nitrogen regulator [Clostridia bacterium]|nr:P-II family nitrogen regulator [Clostridia bacterium]